MGQSLPTDKINSEVPEIEEAYVDSVKKFSSEFDIDIASELPEIEISVGEDASDTNEPIGVDVKLSNPDEYGKAMLENYSIVEGVEEIFESSNVPIHEIVESAAHAVAGIAVNGRERDSMRNLIVNEYFGGLGLGFEDEKLLQNDIEVLKRNLTIQEDFFDSKQVDYVSDNLEAFKVLNDNLLECFEDKEFDEFCKYAGDKRSSIKKNLPSTLNDFEEYSWGKRYDVGSFSEFFLDAFVVPYPIINEEVIDVSEAENLLRHGNEILDDLHEDSVSDLGDDVYERASRNNRSYLVSRLIADDSIKHDLHDYSELVEMSNSEVWRRIGSDAVRYNKEVIDEYSIPSQKGERLDLTLPGNLAEAT